MTFIAEQAADQLPSSGHESLAELCVALAIPIRLRILLLLRSGERNVNALVQELGPRMTQPTVSHHLGLLRVAGLVRPRREGKKVFYALQEPGAAAAAGTGANGAGVSVVAGD